MGIGLIGPPQAEYMPGKRTHEQPEALIFISRLTITKNLLVKHQLLHRLILVNTSISSALNLNYAFMHLVK